MKCQELNMGSGSRENVHAEELSTLEELEAE